MFKQDLKNGSFILVCAPWYAGVEIGGLRRIFSSRLIPLHQGDVSGLANPLIRMTRSWILKGVIC